MQTGSILRRGSTWTLVYYDTQFRAGVKKRVRVWKKLARICKEYPSAASVRQLAADHLAPLNKKQLQPESSRKITEYIEDHYFPAIKTELKPSTIKSYEDAIYYPHLQSRLSNPPIRLRDFRTVDAQRILRDIPNVSHTTLLHFKNFLSGVFRFARREGVLDGHNPMMDVIVPGKRTKFKGAAYSIEDTEVMLEKVLDETASDVLVLLSLTGLRQSEARGLRWSDWNETEQTLMIERAVWNTHVGGTKNPSSENLIPVLPLLAELLRARRTRIKPGPNDYIFAGVKRGTALDFHNLQNRIIKPALKGSGVEWKGFHGFRRGLADNLLELDVNPVVIARILRHGDAATTLRFYARSRDKESRNAMDKLEEKIRNRPSGITFGSKDVQQK